MSEINKIKDNIISTVKQIIIKIVEDEKNISIGAEEFSDNEDIFYSTMLQMSSLMAIRMVVELEKNFKIEIPDDDLDMKNFQNVETIAAYIISMKQL